nr:S8 family serine peptidase [Shewanella putrefaciens]
MFVKSAGNGYQYYRFRTFWLPGDYFTATADKPANYGLPFHNSNMSTDNANVYNLVVSAINAKGKLSSYSSVGSNIFVTAPGGEYGDDDPAIVTTDRMGCENGYAIAEDRPSTPFHGGLHPLNPNCDYNSTMNGTSSAAPNASGAVAVIMSANPDLTWRDVRYILAKTSTKVDADIAAKKVTIGEGEGAPEYVAIPAWQQNAAGFSFHNLYGFGRVNVSEAVKLAKSYAQDLGDYVVTEWQASPALTKAIPDADINGVIDTQVVEENLIVEAVQIELTADHLRLPDLAVELISPAGTKSVLMTPYNGFVYQGVMDKNDPDDLVKGYDATPMLSNAFYGESSKGEWTIKLIDVNSGDYSFIKFDKGSTPIAIPNEADGKLKGWSIRFHGHAAKSAS